MLPHIFQLMMISAIFLDTIERRYPAELRQFLTECTLKAIYVFSKAQILVSKARKQMDAFVESNPDLQQLRNKWKIVFKREAAKPYQYVRHGVIQLTIFTHLKDDGVTAFKRVSYSTSQSDEVCEESDIKFMLMEFITGSATYKIDLKSTSDTYNYYVVGNQFSKEFFLYFLEYHLSLFPTETECSKIRLIDHEVDTVEFEFTEKGERIVLDKTGYRVLVQ